MTIQIAIQDKIAKLIDKDVYIVSSNSDYTVHFEFDAEWDAYPSKTARFKWGHGYYDVLFDGNDCSIPAIHNTRRVNQYVEIGVFAGDLHTTTPVMLPVKWSILSGEGAPQSPSSDVYNQIIEKLDEILKNGEDEAALALLMECGIADPATDGENLYTDSDGAVYIL